MAVLQVVINPLLRVSGGEEHYAFTSVMAQLVFGAASFVSPRVYSWLVVGMDKPAAEQGGILTLMSKLVPANLHWVSMYWVFALFSLIMVAIIFITRFPKVELNEDEKVGSKDSYIHLFKNKFVILYFLGIFAYVGLEQGISYWMTKFLQVYHNIDANTIGAGAVGNFWGLMTVGGVLGLILLKILDSKIVLQLFTSMAIVSLAIALFGGAHLSLLAFQMSGFFLSVMYPVILSLALNSVTEHHGSFAGILMTGIMGGAVVQLLIGAISDFTSLKVGMAFNFVLLAYILSIGFWAKPLIKNQTISLKREKENKK
jgi:fucose permease